MPHSEFVTPEILDGLKQDKKRLIELKRETSNLIKAGISEQAQMDEIEAGIDRINAILNVYDK